MATLGVHVLETLSPEAQATLASHLAPDIAVTSGDHVPGDCDILVAGRPTPEQLAASPRLRALIVPWAGLPDVTRERLRAAPHVAAHNLHHNAAPTAEMALALLLAAAKLLVPADRALRRNDWRPRYADPELAVRLEGGTALVVGYGAIGQRVARGCLGLGMRVLALRRQGPAEPQADETGVGVAGVGSLAGLVPQAQALLLTVPITPATQGLIDAAALARLPDGAIVVNVGRGGVVDEAALFAEVSRGRLRAGLDVWYQYPQDEASRASTPPSRFPFGTLDNVVLSPHRAGAAADDEHVRLAAVAELLNAAARGEAMPNRVDLDAGY